MRRKIIRFLITATAIGISVMAPNLSQAQTNIGPIKVTTSPVWDITGNQTDISFTIANRNETVNASANSVLLQEAANGRVTAGANNATSVQLILSGGISASATFSATDKVSGSISSNRGKGHAQISITMTGSAELPNLRGTGALRRATANRSITATFDNTTQIISGTERDSASASGLGGVAGHHAISDTLPNVFGGDGSWTLTLSNLVESHNRITGTATVVLYTKTTFSYGIHGTIDRQGVTKFILVGGPDAASKGSVFQVTEASSGTITGIKGKIAGQSVDVTF